MLVVHRFGDMERRTDWFNLETGASGRTTSGTPVAASPDGWVTQRRRQRRAARDVLSAPGRLRTLLPSPKDAAEEDYSCLSVTAKYVACMTEGAASA
jgi:hypothetical protein